LSVLNIQPRTDTLYPMLTRRAFEFAALTLLSGLWGCAAAPTAPPPRPTALDRRFSAEVAPPPQMAELLVSAIGLVGVPYRLGGNTMENGFDCSGFTRHLFQTHLGVTLPRRSQDQAGATQFVGVPGVELQPGDLVFFNTLHRANSHVGIYIGDGRFIHAPRTGAVVRLEPMRSGYWLQRYDGARRLLIANPTPAPGG
jgi:cell wall-associated NlpC family hydrolase